MRLSHLLPGRIHSSLCVYPFTLPFPFPFVGSSAGLACLSSLASPRSAVVCWLVPQTQPTISQHPDQDQDQARPNSIDSSLRKNKPTQCIIISPQPATIRQHSQPTERHRKSNRIAKNRKAQIASQTNRKAKTAQKLPTQKQNQNNKTETKRLTRC